MQYQERHIEKAFIKAMKTGISGFHFEFLGQQIPCSVGIIDVVALLRQGVPNCYVDYLWICEIKRGKAPDSAIAQVLAYSHLIQWFLHDRYPEAMEGVSASQAEHNLYPWPVIVAEGLGKMGEKAHLSGVIQFVRYAYHGEGNFSFEYMRDITEYRPPRLEMDLKPFLGDSLKRLYNDPSNWGLFHDRQLQEPVFSLPAIWKEPIKG